MEPLGINYNHDSPDSITVNRVYIKTYGCQMNERDSEAVAAMLRGRGYSIVGNEHDADVVLLNTCSVRDQAEQKAIGKAGYLTSRKRKDPKFVVGIMGCMAQNRGAELLDSLPDLDLLIGTQKFHKVPEHLDAVIQTMNGQGPKPTALIDLEEEAGSQNTIRAHTDKSDVSSFVSIMQGCNMRCNFCIVPKTRGKERSRPIEHIVEEVEELVAKGTREVTLLGQIVTSYGRDILAFKDKKSPFVQLLEQVNEIKGLERIRFTSPHPRGFKEDLIEAYRDLPKLCEYVHLPLQSGSDKMLKAMNRPYRVSSFMNIVNGLRSVAPEMTFSTDIIVGYPGETDEDFDQTVSVFKDVGFDMGFIFKYSPRSGTVSADLVDDVPKEVKEARNQTLLSILEAQSRKTNERLLGTTQEILVEGPARKGESMFMGRTRGFRKAVFKGHPRMIGHLVPIKIEEATVTTVRGTVELTGLD
jgi:tRNA-2-methylthio-N6-dimethylallyladenosine synthase